MTSGKLCIFEPPLDIMRLRDIKYQAMYLAQNRLFINYTVLLSSSFQKEQAACNIHICFGVFTKDMVWMVKERADHFRIKDQRKRVEEVAFKLEQWIEFW